MGLFSNKTAAPSAPPMPPAPNMAPPSDMPVPGMPPAPNMDSKAPNMNASALNGEENTSSEVPDGSNLTPPSLPGSGLDDIKSQVVGDMETSSLSPSTPKKEEIDNSAFESPEISSDEDLFNMFKVDDSEISEQAKTTLSTSGYNSDTKDDSIYNSTQSDAPEVIETHISNDVALNFETKHISKKDETIFLTTTQFKALLEVVDSVKSKIKTSTETHLRLMDMKAEEDVEYESLRKSFQFIEDKLHDLDEILFEN
jgi:hypothetical protein